LVCGFSAGCVCVVDFNSGDSSLNAVLDSRKHYALVAWLLFQIKQSETKILLNNSIILTSDARNLILDTS